MRKFDTKTLKDNIWFFLGGIVIIVLLLFVSYLFGDKTITEEEILANGIESKSKLVINEVCTNNKGIIVANDGGSYDWIELYNGKSHDVDLTNYSLSDTNDKIKWVFPDGTIIKKGEYLIVFLSGKDVEGLIGSFKLSSKGGENLVLRNSNKKIVDAVETKPLSGSQVLARDNDGSWHVYGVATPGYINTLEGYDSFVKNLTLEEDPLLTITEILPSNDGHFKDSYGEYSGYIEILNISNNSVNLKEYAISDDASRPFKYNLPDLTLKKGELFLLYTSNRNSNAKDEYHASFKLSTKNGTVTLSHLNKITEKVNYENLANGLAYIKEKDTFVESATISPGFANTKEGIESFQKKYLKNNESLIITEVMTSNYSYMPHNGGTYYDWIELYNNTKESIKLSDYCLSKNDGSCSMSLPNITIKSHEYYVLMASGNHNLSTDDYKHIDFKLGENDSLYLFKGKTIIDSIFIPKLEPGQSYGRGNGYGVYYFGSPSPNTANENGTIAITVPPIINTIGGIYNNVSNVLVTITGEGTIYYTTDGSNPTTSSNVYKEGILLTKTTVIKAMAKNNDKKNSRVTTASYIINEDHTVPVMSVSIPPGDFSYINSNAWVTGIEKGAYVEYFDSKDGFSVPCGLKLFGGTTRGPAKKSYALKFRKQYGEGSLDYKIFDNRDYSSFDSLVLRTGSQDEPRAFIRDILGTSLVDGVTKAYVQAYKTIILYVNGNYRGIYFIREKVDSDYVKNNFNISDTDNTDLIRIDGEVKSGNKNAYNDLVNYFNTHDMNTDEAYEYLNKKVDLESFADFWIAQTYVTNNDIVNYRYFRNPNIDDGKWKFIFYDLDWAWYNYDNNFYTFASNPSGMTIKGYTTVLFRNIIKNDKFKKLFLERLSYQMKNVWNKERIYEYMDKITKELEPELKRNHERWGYSLDSYKASTEELKNYIEKREKHILRTTKSYFGLSDAQMKEYFGE